MTGRRLGWLGTAFVAVGIAMLVAGWLVQPANGDPGQPGWFGPGMMGGPDMMGGTWPGPLSAPGPGEPGFVAGTVASPRVVRILATPQLRFVPDVVAVRAGETITFEVTTMGPTVHEFMVGLAADVAADKPGTPEIADIAMMQTKSLTFTITGSGPFAFACHAAGHYEAGMTGTVVVQ